MDATVEQINLADRTSGPTFPVDAVEALAGRGLEGDRIVIERSPNGEPVEPKKQITLIEAEALDALRRDCDLDFSAAQSRRNICTRGVALNHLVDRTFTVGAARLKGIELCEPCGIIEKLSGKQGVTKALIHRGGLRAKIIKGGTIRAGDAIRVD